MIALYIRELDVKGGTHKQFYYLADFLKRKGVAFKIITHSYQPEKTFAVFKELEKDIVCVVKKPSGNAFGKILNYVSLIRRVRRELDGISTINVHDNGLQLLFPFLKDKNIIWQINDLPPEFGVGTSKDHRAGFFASLKKYYIKYASRSAVNKITVNVSKNKERVLQAIGMDADVLYCGIEKLNIERDPGGTLKRFAGKKINLLTSGVFMPYRNYETSVQVVKALYQKGYDVRLNIIGNTSLDPGYSKQIQDLIDREELHDSINILGQVDETQFRNLHEQSDVFLFLNIDQSWGLAVFEAMSCGMPVIVSESVGATEILTDHQDALFADPTDHVQIANLIISLTSDESFYNRFNKNGRDFSDKYSWDNSYAGPVLQIIKQFEHPSTGNGKS